MFVALVSGFGWHVQDLARAAIGLGIDLRAIPFPRISGRAGLTAATIEADGVDLTRCSGVLVRMMPPGSLEQVVFRMDALHRLEALGVPVLNAPRAIEAAVDKYLALARLEAAGVPVPETWVGESATEALGAFEELGRDVLVKPLFGSEGRGIVRVSDRELARRTFHTLERLDAVIYVQRVIRHRGYDVRAFVLGDRILGTFRRHVPEGDWRSNVAVGGRPERCRLDPGEEQLARDAARAVGAEMAGIDLIFDLDRKRWVVLEVNAVPGWRALGEVTGIDAATAILEHLRGSR